MNPLGKGPTNTNNNNPISNMLDFLNNGGSKEQIFEQVMKNNPRLNAMVGMQNPKEMVMRLAKQKGVDINQIEELARKLGAK